MTLASVIVLTYKNYDNIKKTIDSVFSQDYSNIELIIQDDCADNFNYDHIKSLVDNNKKKLVNVIIHKNDVNLGTVKNFNSAIAKSSGEIIIGLGGNDCFSDNTVVSDVINYFAEHKNCNILKTNVKGEKDNNIIPTASDVEWILTKDKQEMIQRMFFQNFISGAGTYFRKSFLTKNFFDERFFLLEDHPFFIKTLLDGGEINYYDRITLLYNQDGVSNQKNVPLQLFLDGKVLHEKYILPNLGFIKSKKLKRYFMYRYIRYYKCSFIVKKIIFNLFYFDMFVLHLYAKIRKLTINQKYILYSK